MNRNRFSPLNRNGFHAEPRPGTTPLRFRGPLIWAGGALWIACLLAMSSTGVTWAHDQRLPYWKSQGDPCPASDSEKFGIGGVCAEWTVDGEGTGRWCCIPRSEVGGNNPHACLYPIDGVDPKD